ncbi:MAG: DUF4375 domain-containing protein [Gammaproteobacteria bacterium]|nr:DUF4375 domain-containing protein [Gammaproteobacteria bacterium]
MEISTEENEAIVRRIGNAAAAAAEAKVMITPEQQNSYDIDYLVMEANSGASFEQYFRWTSVDEISRIVLALRVVGMEDIAELAERAIDIAFPGGVPVDDEIKSDLTAWSEEQERSLESLFPSLENQNGRITNTLAAYATKAGA